MNNRADNVSDAEPNEARSEMTAQQDPAEQADMDSTSTSTTSPAEGTPRRGWRRKALLVTAAATLGLVAVGGATAAGISKHVTIAVDGEQREITTLAGSVDGALSAAGLQAGAHDVLAPAGDTQIADGATIALERGKPLALTINGLQRTVWTTADTVDQALVQLGQDPRALELSANRSRIIPLSGLAVTANALRTVSVSDGGAAAVKVRSGARTVADLLAEKKITLGKTDKVSPAIGAPIKDGLAVSVTRVAVTTTTKKVQVAAANVQTDDASLAKGKTVVAKKGTPGQVVVTTQVTSVNGKATASREVSRTTVSKATPNQIRVGTKSSLDIEGGRVFFHDTEFGVNWDGLAFCESTNNPHAINNPAGFLSTFGLFQFDEPTWATVGGSGNPGDASPVEQLKRAKMLYQSRGLEPWLCGYAASGPPAG